MLVHLHLEISAMATDIDTCSGESILDCVSEGGRVANAFYRDDGCCQIRTVIRQHRRISADLRPSRGGVPVAAQMIIKAPGADAFAQEQQFPGFARIGAMGQQAVEW